MIDKASEQQLSSALRDYFLPKIPFGSGTSSYMIMLDSRDFQKLKLQYRALGLITKETSQKSLKDTSTYWTLTPYGDLLMTQAIAAKSTRPALTAVASDSAANPEST
jgi:hypothetical protein